MQEPDDIKLIRQKKVMTDDDVARYNDYMWQRTFGTPAPKRH